MNERKESIRHARGAVQPTTIVPARPGPEWANRYPGPLCSREDILAQFAAHGITLENLPAKALRAAARKVDFSRYVSDGTRRAQNFPRSLKAFPAHSRLTRSHSRSSMAREPAKTPR